MGKAWGGSWEFSVVETGYDEHKSVIKTQFIVPLSLLWHKPGNIISAGTPEMSSFTPTRLKIALQINTHEHWHRVTVYSGLAWINLNH